MPNCSLDIYYAKIIPSIIYQGLDYRGLKIIHFFAELLQSHHHQSTHAIILYLYSYQ